MTNPREMLGRGPVVCDGAMGTMLHAAGNSLDQALPALNLTNAALVRTIHDSYVGAGVNIIQTNTFGASRLRLSEYGFGERVDEINRAGVRLARQAAEAGRSVLVAGSVSPAVSVQQRRRVRGAQRAGALREQIEILVDAGVDLVLLETFGYLDELVEAVEVATAASEVPVIAQATFATDTQTLSGHTPREVVSALAGSPIVALGTNCTLGPQRSLAVLRELRAHTELPLTVQPNAGLPRRVAPARFEYDIDSEYFVRYVRQLLEAGASVVGGCCGTTPTQLAAIVVATEEYRGRSGSVAATEARPRRPSEASATTAPISSFAEMDHLVVEITPPPTGGVDESLDVARRLCEAGTRLISVAASRSTAARVNPVDLALHLHQRLGVDTVASVTTWDRTIMALQADLLGAHALGVRRIVCETGTPPLLGDYPHVDGIWDVDSLGLIELLAGLNDGNDYYGLRLPAKTEFEIGARINPGSREPELEAAEALRKISAGAQFLITRPVYARSHLERLLELLADHRVPVLAAVQPLTSFSEAEFLAHEVPDVRIPRDTLAALEAAGEQAREVGIELAAELVSRIRGLVNGIVLAPSGDPVRTVHAVGARAFGDRAGSAPGG